MEFELKAPMYQGKSSPTVAEEQLPEEALRNPIITLDLSAIASLKNWDLSTMQAVTPVDAFNAELDVRFQ